MELGGRLGPQGGPALEGPALEAFEAPCLSEPKPYGQPCQEMIPSLGFSPSSW